MALQDDLKILDAWYDDQPRKAARFAVALEQRYSNIGSQRDRLRQFKKDAPQRYSAMMTQLEATYEATEEDVQREVGKQVLARIQNRG